MNSENLSEVSGHIASWSVQQLLFKLICFFLHFQEVEYLAYFCPAEYVYRVDRPKETHPVGRD
jgi:hypothetical protein